MLPTGRPASSSWPARNPGSRSWAMVPMDQGRRSAHWARPSTNGPSSLGRQNLQYPVASNERTSSLTSQRAPSPAQLATRSRSPKAALPSSETTAMDVPCGNGAPLPKTVALSTSILMTTNWWNPDVRGERVTSPRTIGGGDRWWNVPSHGWSPTITGGSGSGEWEPPWSLDAYCCHQSQADDQPRTRARGRMATHNVLSAGAQARVVKKGPLFGLCPPGWPTSTLSVPALRSDISRTCRCQPTPEIRFVQQSPSEPSAQPEIQRRVSGMGHAAPLSWPGFWDSPRVVLHGATGHRLCLKCHV